MILIITVQILGLLNLIVISIAVDTLRRFKEQQKSAGKDEGKGSSMIVWLSFNPLTAMNALRHCQ